MAKLIKLIIVMALLAGIYLAFFQAEWFAMDSQDLGITALAPAPGERGSNTEQDRTLGLHKVDEVFHIADREMFSIARVTSRKITHGSLNLTDYETSLIEGSSKDLKMQHQSTKRIEHKSISGIEVKFLLPDGKTEAYSRLFPKGDAVYSMNYISPGSLKHTYRRYRFFSSLEFDD